MSNNPYNQYLSGEATNTTPPPQRRDTESSTNESEHSQSTLDAIPSSSPSIEIYRSGAGGNLQLISSLDKAPLYFIRSSIFRPGIADVTIFTGNDTKGTVIGVCNYERFSHTLTIGRGDPAQPNTMEWEAVSKASRDHSAYKCTIWSSGTERERKTYNWKRTGDPSMKGTESSKVDRRSWKLEDDAGTVMAVFAAKGIKKGWKSVGKLRFLVSEGSDWEEWVLLAVFGLYEKARRRAMARRDLSWFF